MNTFLVEFIGSTSRSDIFARIKRFDNKFYNPTTKRFEANPLLKVSLLPDPIEPNIYRPQPEIQRGTEFIDGEYVIYYYEGVEIVKVVREDVVNFIGLTAKTLTDTAIRIAGIQTVDGGLKKTLDKISTQLDRIEERLNANP